MSPGHGRSAPRSLAVICDTPHHLDPQGRLHGLESVVVQLEYLAELFDDVVIACPILDGPPPVGFSRYATAKVRHEPLPLAGGNTLRAKLAMIPKVPVWAWRTRRIARSVDAVHLRCPCNIGMVALLSTWRATPYRYAMYAGVWRPYPGEPRFFRYQRELIASRWYDGVATIYASPDPAHPNLEPLFSPSFDHEDWEKAGPAAAAVRERIGDVDRTEPWRFVVVGRLTPNKNQQAAVAALADLVAGGVDATLDVLGDGPQRPALEAQVAAAGLVDRVRFHGMVDRPQVLEAFAASDLQLLTTRQEGFGKVLLESMVYGVVPVFGQSPVSAEISGDGTRAVVIDPDDPVAIADAVRALLEDRPRWIRLSDAARDYTRGVTLEAFGARLRTILERHWDVSFEPGAEAA